MAGTLQDVSDANFQAEVIESDAPVLVDFWAPWCGPCRVVAPVLEEIASERPDLRIVKLNVDDNQQTAAAFDVLSIPTMILFKNGQVAKKIVGAYPKRKLEAEIEPVARVASRGRAPRKGPPRRALVVLRQGTCALPGAARSPSNSRPSASSRARTASGSPSAVRRRCRRTAARGARRAARAASARR